MNQAPRSRGGQRVGRVSQFALRDVSPGENFPPGPADSSLARTHQIAHDPLSILMPLYEEYGPIFSVRLLDRREVFMIGPEANYFITVAHPENFHWREGNFGELIPLIGDGLLTIDGDYHDRSRAIMLPAFHRRQLGAAVDAMEADTEAAIVLLHPGEIVDVYDWMRNLAMRIAMRALLGLDPDETDKGAAAAEHFERALHFYGIDYPLRLLRGPDSPWEKMHSAREVLDEIVFDEISRRRADPDPERTDILSLLIIARGEAGEAFTDQEIRDHVVSLMFAGHDTAASALTFMMYELARHPRVLSEVLEEEERVLGGTTPTPEQLESELPYLDMVLDEVLRLYPPGWISPRRAMRDFEFGGYSVPEGASVNYCSLVSHRLPEVFPEPEAFIPERFTRERKMALPRGAYVPFGGGSRICLGKRFGQTEVKLVATMLLQRLRLEALPDYTMSIRQMPTLSPRDGLPMRITRAEAFA